MKKNVFFLAAMFAITSFVTAQTVVFSDNFDSYTAGSHLAQVNPAWTTWSDVSGGSDDGVISTAQAFSAPNSLLVDYGIDQVFPFNNYTSGHYMIEFKLFVPSSSPGAYFNIQHIMRGQWAFHCNFQSNGIGYVFVANTSYPFNYSLDAWVSVLIDVDLDNDQASVSINNNLVHSWPFHYSAATAIGANQLAGVNICSSGSAHMTFYVDDFVVTEVSAAQFGEFEVSPENLILNMAPNTTAAEPIVMGNPGEAATHFRVVPTYDIPNPDPTSTGVTDLHYYMGQIPYTSITFYSDDPNVDLAVCIPSSALQSHIGKTLNEIDVYFASSITNTKICVYAMNDMLVNRQPGEVVYEQPFTAVNGWNHVPLTTPYLIDGSDLWFGISYVETGSGHIYLDGFPANDYSCWAHNNNYWLNHFDGYDYNLMIGGKIDGTPITPWINMEQLEGTIAPGATISDNVIVNTNGMNLGETRTAHLYCYSSDSENSEVVVPVTLNITSVSVNDHNQIEVNVYPNPATDYVQVNSENIEKVEIFNMLGQQVFSQFYGDNRVVIPTTGMAPGSYVVKVTTTTGSTSKQVIIK